MSTSSEASVALAAEDLPGPTPRRNLLRDVVTVLLVLVVIGVLGGVLWSQVVTPADYAKVANGAVMDEDQVARQFGADGWYAVIGVVAAFLVGVVAMWRRTGAELRTAGALVLGSLLAAALMAVTGHLLGPGDPRPVLSAAKVGTLVPERLSVGSPSLFPLGAYLHDVGGAATIYLAWPFGVLLGALFALLGRSPAAAGGRSATRG